MKKILLPAIVVFFGIWLFTPSPVLAVEKAFSRAAYNPDKNQFLIVWTDSRYHQNPDGAECYTPGLDKAICDNAIFGYFLDKDLKQIGSDLAIAKESWKDETYPEVAYNSKRKEYLIVYERCDGDCQINTYALWNIYATRLNENGGVIETIPIFTGDLKQWEPTVAYNDINDQYLIAFMGYFPESADGGKDVKVQRLSGDGQKIGQPYYVSVEENGSNALGWQERPVVSFIPDNASYFLAWENHQKKSIGGTILNASGEIVISPKNFSLEPETGDKYYPQISYNQINKEVLVVWQNNQSTKRTVEAHRMNFLGEKIGSLIVLDDNAGPQYNPRPGLACDLLNGSCLVTWMNETNVNYGLKAQFLDQNGQKVGDRYWLASNGDRSTIVFNKNERYFLVIKNRQRSEALFGARIIPALPAAEPASLDLNADGKIDEVDLSLLLKSWGQFDKEDLEMLLLNWEL